MANPKEASFRIVRHEGQYRVEVLDKTINFWYIVASKMGQGEKGFEKAIEYCKKFIKQEGQ